MILDPKRFSAAHTFDCGQCFRWMRQPDGSYKGVAGGRPATIYDKDGRAVIECDPGDLDYFNNYLDLDRDYASIALSFPRDDFTSAAIEHGYGLRILRQEPWEALISFIISQCNNIQRIQGIISRLCSLFGDKIADDLYAFPTAERLAQLCEEDLAPLRAGYRAAYILSAAKSVASGSFVPDDIYSMDTPEARKALMSLNGVGGKVADCVLLFGYGKLDAFPVDTWMKKARAYYPGGMDPTSFGSYAGIAQQYIFYYARSGMKK